MTALDLIKTRVTVDIDQLDPALAEELGPFCDMTSNQALIAGVVTAEPEPAIVQQVIDIVRQDGKTGDEGAEYAMDLFAVLLAKAVLPYINGRVHAQLSPRYAASSTASLAHAHRLVSLFNSHGIPTSRICLKIPTNGAGMTCAAQLEREGIRTLATTLFSVDQALAAVQAGCLYIAPYFNELSVHFDPETWCEYEDTAAEHPMAPVIKHIVETYKRIERRPLIMPASIVTSTEALAISTLGVDHITIAGKVLQALANDREGKAFRGERLDVRAPSSEILLNGNQAHDEVDFLEADGQALDQSIAKDESVARRLSYALKTFGDCERKVLDLVRSRLA